MSSDNLFVDKKTDMNFRKLLIEERGFRIFEIYCAVCDEKLIQVSDLTESDLKNEALILYRIHDHARTTGHSTIHGDIEPKSALQHIDATITIDNV